MQASSSATRWRACASCSLTAQLTQWTRASLPSSWRACTPSGVHCCCTALRAAHASLLPHPFALCRQAYERAAPTILEPVMHVEVCVCASAWLQAWLDGQCGSALAPSNPPTHPTPAGDGAHRVSGRGHWRHKPPQGHHHGQRAGGRRRGGPGACVHGLASWADRARMSDGVPPHTPPPRPHLARRTCR